MEPFKRELMMVIIWICFIVIVGYAFSAQGVRVGYYKACQDMGLDLIIKDDLMHCDNLTRLNMIIDEMNKGYVEDRWRDMAINLTPLENFK